MTKLLFVDDEQNVLDSLENQLFEKMDDWDMRFVSCGNTAIELMKNEVVDVLVTDMRMPGVDGPQLLEYAKNNHPATMRIVLSGHAEIEAAMKAIPIAHQYIGKPCEQTLLLDTIYQALEVHEASTDDEVRRALGKVMNLPCRMQVYNKLVETLSDENVGFEHVASIVDTDPSLTTRLIFAANTAFFAGGAAATNTLQSVQRLGLEGTRMLVMATEITGLLGNHAETTTVRHMQEHSQHVASIIAVLADDESRAESVLAAIVHDLGAMIFANFLPSRYRKCVQIARNEDVTLTSAEEQEFGVNHAKLGELVLNLWKLPTGVSFAVGMHHNNDASAFGSRSVAVNLALAEILAESIEPIETAKHFVATLPDDEHSIWLNKLDKFAKQRELL